MPIRFIHAPPARARAALDTHSGKLHMHCSTGIKRFLLGGLASLAILSAHADQAQAATAVVDGDGYATGITGVTDGGNTYVIDFVSGPYNTALPSGVGFADGISVTFQINAALNALVAATELRPTGESGVGYGFFLVPDGDTGGAFAFVVASQLVASGGGQSWFFQDSFPIDVTEDCPANNCNNGPGPELFAVISGVAAEVPAPAALPLLALGLGGLGLMARRRKAA